MAREYYKNGVKQEVAPNLLGTQLRYEMDNADLLTAEIENPDTVEFRRRLIETSTTPAIKNDDRKLRYDLVPFDALDEVVKVLNFGAAKYSARNWEAGFSFGRPLAATFRHLSAWARGEEKDSESGLSHLAHAACNVFFLLAFTLRGVGTDDRAITRRENDGVSALSKGPG